MTILTNIQDIFRLLKPDQIRAYLLRSGWRASPQDGSDQLAFELPAVDGDSPSRLWLWASESHPKYRSRIPNVIFTLAVVESREALAIAQDMLRIVTTRETKAAHDAPQTDPRQTDQSPSSAAIDSLTSSSAGGSSGLWIANSRRDPLRIAASGSSLPFTLPAGAKVRITDTSGDPIVDVRDDGLAIRTIGAGTLSLYSVASGDLEQLVERWRQGALAVDLDRSPAESTAERWAACEAMLRQVAFVVEPLLGRDPAGVRTVGRQAAVVAATLHGVMANPAADSASQDKLSAAACDLIWETVVFVLGLAQMGLRWSPNAAEDLVGVLAADAGGTPERTAAWIADRVIRMDE